MPAFPLRLARPDGRRRLELLITIDERDRPVVMDDMDDRTEREDLRWLWRKHLVEIIATNPLRYEVAQAGRSAIEGAPAEFEKVAEKQRIKDAEEAKAKSNEQEREEGEAA